MVVADEHPGTVGWSQMWTSPGRHLSPQMKEARSPRGRGVLRSHGGYGGGPGPLSLSSGCFLDGGIPEAPWSWSLAGWNLLSCGQAMALASVDPTLQRLFPSCSLGL